MTGSRQRRRIGTTPSQSKAGSTTTLRAVYGAELRAAYALLGDSYELIRSGGCRGTLEQELLRATGRLHMCTGWLAFDAGRHDVAEWCYTEALSLATETDDAELGTRALIATISAVPGTRPVRPARSVCIARRTAAACSMNFSTEGELSAAW